jgi:hypothetical protein
MKIRTNNRRKLISKIIHHEKDNTGGWSITDFTPINGSESDTLKIPPTDVGPINTDDFHKLLNYVELRDLVKLIRGNIALMLSTNISSGDENKMKEKYGPRWKSILTYKVLDDVQHLYKQVVETLPELNPSNRIKTLTLYTLALNTTAVEFTTMLDDDITEGFFDYMMKAQVAALRKTFGYSDELKEEKCVPSNSHLEAKEEENKKSKRFSDEWKMFFSSFVKDLEEIDKCVIPQPDLYTGPNFILTDYIGSRYAFSKIEGFDDIYSIYMIFNVWYGGRLEEPKLVGFTRIRNEEYRNLTDKYCLAISFKEHADVIVKERLEESSE